MYIKVTVTAGARQEVFEEVGKSRFKATVKEKAERNMANSRVIELVANHFNINKNKVKIINGHHHPSKLLVLDL